MSIRACLLALVLLTGCPTGPRSQEDGGSDAGGNGGGDAGGVLSAAFFPRIAGLWTGQAAQTPLGSFPLMNVDYRAVDGYAVFGRVDIDAQNNLHEDFSLETVGAVPTLVYRNGGYFMGTLRDDRLQLMDFDDAAGSYHFCAEVDACMYVNDACVPEQGGCPFIDATFDFSGTDQLVLNVHVMGQEHLIWTATRKEPRDVPSPFPTDPTPRAGDAGWPTLPQLSMTVSWSSPLSQPTPVFVILSDMPCQTGTCTFSRTLSTTAPMGATSATLLFDEIHAGSYDANAVVDLKGGFGTTTFVPPSGDLISVPDQSITVPAAGQGTASLAAIVTVP